MKLYLLSKTPLILHNKSSSPSSIAFFSIFLYAFDWNFCKLYLLPEAVPLLQNIQYLPNKTEESTCSHVGLVKSFFAWHFLAKVRYRIREKCASTVFMIPTIRRQFIRYWSQTSCIPPPSDVCDKSLYIMDCSKCTQWMSLRGKIYKVINYCPLATMQNAISQRWVGRWLILLLWRTLLRCPVFIILSSLWHLDWFIYCSNATIWKSVYSLQQ